jgi:hypothetical protein
MRVLSLGVSPIVLVEDKDAAEEWMNIRNMTDDEKAFLRWNFQWIDVMTIEDVRNAPR